MRRTLTEPELARFTIAALRAQNAAKDVALAEAQLAALRDRHAGVVARARAEITALGLDPDAPLHVPEDGPHAGVVCDARTGAPVEFPDPPPADVAARAADDAVGDAAPANG